LAGPVAIAGFAERYISIRIIFAQWMFLTSTNILGPITGVSLFIVQETTNAKLFSSSTIPTSPITSTRCFVSKYAIKPVTVFSTNGGIVTFTTVAVRSMRIVADTDEAMSSVSGINKAVGTGSKDRLIVVTSVQLIEMVAIFFVRQSSLLGLTVGLIESVNVGRRSLRLRSGAVTINRLRRYRVILFANARIVVV